MGGRRRVFACCQPRSPRQEGRDGSSRRLNRQDVGFLRRPVQGASPLHLRPSAVVD